MITRYLLSDGHVQVTRPHFTQKFNKMWWFLTDDVNNLLTVIAITPKFTKAFMKVVILTNIGSNKGSQKSVVIAINVINEIFVIAIKVLRFITQSKERLPYASVTTFTNYFQCLELSYYH